MVQHDELQSFLTVVRYRVDFVRRGGGAGDAGDAGNAKVDEATELLGETVVRELKEVVAKTKFARDPENTERIEDEEGKKEKYEVDCGADKPESCLGDDLAKYKNGEELDKLLDLCKKVQKHFGKAMAGGDYRKAARTLQREIGSGKKKLVVRLLQVHPRHAEHFLPVHVCC